MPVVKHRDSPSSRKRSRAAKREDLSDSENIAEDSLDVSDSKKVKRRKTKAEKEADAMPLAARTSGIRMLIGAHVSGSKGVQNSVTNAVHIG